MKRTDADALILLEPDLQMVLDELLAAVPDDKRPHVQALVGNPRYGGQGLRAWLSMQAAEYRPLPGTLPGELIDVYLHDDEAEPLHDCERCGLAVPVRTVRRTGHEPTVERVYFPTCPHCGGRTGRYAYWSGKDHAPVT